MTELMASRHMRGKVFNELGGLIFRFGGSLLDQSILFLEFEYMLAIAVIFIMALMYLFYVKYPYNKDLD